MHSFTQDERVPAKTSDFRQRHGTDALGATLGVVAILLFKVIVKKLGWFAEREV